MKIDKFRNCLNFIVLFYYGRDSSFRFAPFGITAKRVFFGVMMGRLRRPIITPVLQTKVSFQHEVRNLLWRPQQALPKICHC